MNFCVGFATKVAAPCRWTFAFHVDSQPIWTSKLNPRLKSRPQDNYNSSGAATLVAGRVLHRAMAMGNFLLVALRFRGAFNSNSPMEFFISLLLLPFFWLRNFIGELTLYLSLQSFIEIELFHWSLLFVCAILLQVRQKFEHSHYYQWICSETLEDDVQN